MTEPGFLGHPEQVVSIQVVRLLAAAPLPMTVAVALGLVSALWLGLFCTASIRAALVMAGASAGGAVLSVCDALSRLAEARRVRRILARRGFDPRVFDAMARSRCQRDAALHAARQAGCIDEAKAHYRSRGFAWHHLLPQGATSAPWRLLAPRFLKGSFLAFRRPRRPRS